MQALNQRSRDIFKQIVETYLETGEPVGSRTLSKAGIELSAASIRNVMSDLTELGLLDAPHVSAGRMPTHAGLRLFVDGFLEMGDPGHDDRAAIEGRLNGAGRDLSGVLKEASSLLSGLAGGAGLVSSPTQDAAVRHVEFVPLSTGEALCVLVKEQGDVENRLVKIPAGLPQTVLIEAGNYLAARMKGRTLYEAAIEVRAEIAAHQAQRDAAVVQQIATHGGMAMQINIILSRLGQFGFGRGFAFAVRFLPPLGLGIGDVAFVDGHLTLAGAGDEHFALVLQGCAEMIPIG